MENTMHMLLALIFTEAIEEKHYSFPQESTETLGSKTTGPVIAESHEAQTKPESKPSP